MVPAGSFELQVNNAITNPISTNPTSSFGFVTYSPAMIVLDQLNKGINLVATVGTFVSTQLSSED